MNSYRRGLRNGVLVNQNYSSLKKSTLVHIPSVGQTWSNLVKLGQMCLNSYYLVWVITIEVGESSITGLDLIRDTSEKVDWIRKRLFTAQS